MKSEVRARSRIVAVRLTPEEKTKFTAFAGRQGRALPDLMRLCVEAALLQEAILEAESMTPDTAACPHTSRSDEALCVLPAKPRSSHYVRCPCCGLSGWQDDGDLPVMVCPDCLVEAVSVNV